MTTRFPAGSGSRRPSGPPIVVLDLGAGPAEGLAMAFAVAYHATAPGDVVDVRLAPEVLADRVLVADLATGGGFTWTGAPGASGPRRATASGTVRLTRARSLPDTVGPGMRVLICGLNPSTYAADAGLGFARPGNRFWPAAMAAGLVEVPRDPRGALEQRGVGMTDLVKRATRRADELDPAEYADGLARVERLVGRLAPTAVCFVGLDGWRRARDRRAVPGWQPGGVGGAPAYVMPSTSGLNAHVDVAALAEHLRAVLAGPP